MVQANTIPAAATPTDQQNSPSAKGGSPDIDSSAPDSVYGSGSSPSDSEIGSGELGAPQELTSILEKMEELNKMNEQDTRSIISKASGGSSSSQNGGGRSTSPTPPEAKLSSSRQNSCQATATATSVADDDDENIDLWTVWGNLIKSWECEMKKRPSCVKELVRRGIPQHFRTIAWQLLSGSSSAAGMHEQYTELLRQASPYEKVIVRDIPRTYPELDFFKDGGRGQQALFNVIKAYSVYDAEVGYCQGSAFIVGQLLLQMPEEEAFAVFVRLMEHYRLRELYKPMMTELGLCIFQLEVIVAEQMPDLHAHFNNVGFDTSMMSSSWFLTLFTTTLPLELANRIMDLFLVDGMDAIFRLAIAILQQARIDLLKLDMEGILKYFQRDIRERYEGDQELLFSVAARVSLNAKRMKRLEKEYLSKRTKEQEEAIELRRLRTENRLLRQRIDYLEHESSALADRLIRGQVDLAQQAENSLNISHELNTLRDINSAAHRQLENAYETIRELSSAGEDGEQKCIDTGTQVDDSSMIEHIHSLQQELIETHSRKADLEGTVRDLKLRIHELESANKRLKECPPDGGVASLQEELIRVKMREAEASLALKEMRQRLAEVEHHWAKYMQSRSNAHPVLSASQSLNNFEGLPTPPPPTPSTATAGSEPPADPSTGAATDSPDHPPPLSTATTPAQSARGRIAQFTATLIGAASSSLNHSGGASSIEQDEGISLKELEDQYMGLKIRETDMHAELTEMRQKVMELETQLNCCTNQLRRQDDELKRLKEEKEAIGQAEREVSNLLKEEQRRLMEVQSEMKEKNVMQRLKYTEALQTIADLKQQLAQLESKSAERMARMQLRGSSICDLDDDSLASNRSAGGSMCDTTSLASEEMTAFLADVTTKIPAELNSNGGSGAGAEVTAAAGVDTGDETEGADEDGPHPPTTKKTAPSTTGSSKRSKSANPQQNDTADSGLNMSDHS